MRADLPAMLGWTVWAAITLGCGPTRSPTSLPNANSAKANPAALPLPADDAAIAIKLRDPDGLSHVRGYPVDEDCLDVHHLSEALVKLEPPHLTVSNVRGVNRASIEDPSPSAFKSLSDWIGHFPPSNAHRFIVARLLDEKVHKGFTVDCVSKTAIVSDGDFGRVIHKDSATNEKQLDIAFTDAVLIRMKLLPANVQRIVFLYDDTDLLAGMSVDDLRKLERPVFTLVRF